MWYSIINRYNNTGFELKSQFHSKFGGNLKDISILKSGNTIIMQTLAGNLLAAICECYIAFVVLSMLIIVYS
jgi:hypothetical protein